jgi:uncharacterized protein (TIGR03437 family)
MIGRSLKRGRKFNIRLADAIFSQTFYLAPIAAHVRATYSGRRGTVMKTCVLILFATGIMAWAQLPVVPPGSIVNGASFAAGEPITGGSLISIFGTNLSMTMQHAGTIPLSKSLGGVTVHFVNGSTITDAPLLDVLPGQINLQVPWNVVPPNSSAPVSVVVQTGAGSSQLTPVLVGPFSPGIFATGPNLRAIVQNNTDFTLAQPAGSIPGLTTHPAKHGDVLIIYATGLGAVGSAPPDGAPAGNQSISTLTVPTVLIGGIPVTGPDFIYSVLSPQFVGVNQVAVKVPANAPTGDSVSIQIQMGGITSPANVIMAVSQ